MAKVGTKNNTANIFTGALKAPVNGVIEVEFLLKDFAERGRDVNE